MLYRKESGKNHPTTAIELHGKTIGVIGFGHIGNRVAQLGVAFGMHVLVATRTVHGSMQKELEVLGGKYVSLKELLKNADVVTVHIPATKDTEKLIGKNEFAHMKRLRTSSIQREQRWLTSRRLLMLLRIIVSQARHSMCFLRNHCPLTVAYWTRRI